MEGRFQSNFRHMYLIPFGVNYLEYENDTFCVKRVSVLTVPKVISIKQGYFLILIQTIFGFFNSSWYKNIVLCEKLTTKNAKYFVFSSTTFRLNCGSLLWFFFLQIFDLKDLCPYSMKLLTYILPWKMLPTSSESTC